MQQYNRGMLDSLTRQAISATRHCLTGCAIGEVAGMVIASALHATAFWSVALSIILAFVFGYSLSLIPLLAAGLAWRRALAVALAADTVSITTMEIADNAFVLAVPGALTAGLTTWLFWISLACSLVVAFVVTVPVNRWLIARGRGHAVMHQYHH
jgi:hypothetical protein